VTLFTSLIDWPVICMKALRDSSRVGCEEEANT